jgi:hypothetical protein
VDVVKFFFVEPVVLRIIDFEAAVGWDTISNFNKILHKGSRREMKMKHKLDGLNRTQIRSQNIWFWILFRELNSPDASPSPEIKDIFRVFEGCEVGFPVESELAQMVLQSWDD